MNGSDLGNALKRIIDENNNKKIEILLLDACNMGVLEIAYELKDYIRIMVSSEAATHASPLVGSYWGLDWLLKKLRDDPSMSSTEFATNVVDRYIDWPELRAKQVGSTTCAAIDLGKIGNLVNKINETVQILMDKMNLYRGQIKDAYIDSQNYELNYMRDLHHFFAKINEYIDDPEVDQKTNNVMQMLTEGEVNSAIIHNRYWTCPGKINVDNSHGLAVYFPDDPAGYFWLYLFQEGLHYGDLSFNKTKWSDFIVWFLDEEPPETPDFGSDHEAGRWYNDNDILFVWDKVNDLGYQHDEEWSIPGSGLQGYGYILDHNPTTLPTEINLDADQIQLIINDIPDGEDWYFHLRAVDNVGNWGETDHYGPLKIDTVSPDAPIISSSTHPTEDEWYSNNDPCFGWTIPYDPTPSSGIDGYAYALDDSSSTIPTGVDTSGNSKCYDDIDDGIWWFHVRAKDNAGNWGDTDHYKIKIDTQPPNDWDDFEPSDWINDQTPDCSIKVKDVCSGLDVSTAYYSYSTDGGTTWSSWISTDCTGSDGTNIYQTITAYSVPFNQDSDDQNKIKFKIQDMLNHVGYSPVETIKIDTVPPGSASGLGSTSHETEEWSDDNTIDVSWTPAQDHPSSGLAGYAAIWDNNPTTIPDPIMNLDASFTSTTSPPLDEGDNWYFHIRSVDKAGNWNDTAIHLGPFFVDATPPVTTHLLSGIEGENGWYISNVDVTLSATDGGTGVNYTKYRVDDGTWETYTSPFTISDEGVHTLEYYSVDNISNQEDTNSIGIKIDKTPPTVNVTYPDGEEFLHGTIVIRWDANDNIDTNLVISIKYSPDNGTTWQEITEGETNNGNYDWDAEDLEGTQFLVKVIAKDDAGNIANDTSNNTFTIDNKPPYTTKNIGDPKYQNGTWVKSNTQFNLTAMDNVSGVNKTYYGIWNTTHGWTPWIEYTGNFTLSEEGKHYLEFYSVDYAGNVENVTNQTHFVDNTRPETTIEFGEPIYGNHITSSTPIYLNSTDEGCGVKEIWYSYDGGNTWNVVNGSKATFTIPDECHHVIQYYAVDNLGNTENVKTREINVDNTSPETSIEISAPHLTDGTMYWLGRTTLVYLNATEKGPCSTGEYTIWYRLWNMTGWTPWMHGDTNSNVTINITGKGRNYLEYYAEDALGNVQLHNATIYIIPPSRIPCPIPITP